MTTSEGEQVSDKAEAAFTEWWYDSNDVIVEGVGHHNAQLAWHAAVAWATARERERAAKVAETCGIVRPDWAEQIAAAIRKGDE